MSEPKRNTQKANAFSRGNATSGAPICSGMMTLAKPANSGVANISSISVPCMVNSWLYCSFVSMICIPGANSSRRMSTAITPAMQKKRNDAIRYMYPMVLWSVEVSQLTMTLPLLTGTFGAAPRSTGRSATAVICQHLLSGMGWSTSVCGRILRRVHRCCPVHGARWCRPGIRPWTQP